MPRTARIVIHDCAHHVTQRGNNRQDVFYADSDRQVYLEYLLEASKQDITFARWEQILERRLRPLPRGRSVKITLEKIK